MHTHLLFQFSSLSSMQHQFRNYCQSKRARCRRVVGEIDNSLPCSCALRESASSSNYLFTISLNLASIYASGQRCEGNPPAGEERDQRPPRDMLGRR